MFISNYDIQNYRSQQWLDTQLNEPTNQNAMLVLKVVKTTNKKTLIYNFGDFCNKQPIVPFPPEFLCVV